MKDRQVEFQGLHLKLNTWHFLMSWAVRFPVLDDEMLDRYRAGVADVEREVFGVGE